MKKGSFHVEHCTPETLKTCPVCGANGSSPALTVQDHSISKHVFELVDCSACGFRYTNPRPIGATLSNYYESEDYISHSNANLSVRDKLYQAARKIALRQKHRLIKGLVPNGKVLDIGCGTGEFLAYLMSRGYLVQGIEPSLKAREQVIANYSIPVVPSLEVLPHQEQFNVVTLWHVLEHIPDLHTYMKRIFALLAESGHLVIAVPDRESWDAEHYGSSWAAYDVPRHLSHFRIKDVSRLLTDHGFELIKTKRMWMDPLYISMLSEQYNGSGKLLALIKGATIGKWSNFVSLISGRPTSSTLYVAQKKDF